jgi:hypothetical protein
MGPLGLCHFGPQLAVKMGIVSLLFMHKKLYNFNDVTVMSAAGGVISSATDMVCGH